MRERIRALVVDVDHDIGEMVRLALTDADIMSLDVMTGGIG